MVVTIGRDLHNNSQWFQYSVVVSLFLSVRNLHIIFSDELKMSSLQRVIFPAHSKKKPMQMLVVLEIYQNYQNGAADEML